MARACGKFRLSPGLHAAPVKAFADTVADMPIWVASAGSFISGGPEQPLHCLLQRIPC